MLRELRIRNLAIIDDLTVRFAPGLNVLTGETGAGKSIIVDALGLALGNRAQSDLMKSGAKEASVQAWFEISNTNLLPDIGIDTSEGLLIRRVLSSGGRSRAFINDTMVTLQTLAEAGRRLVDIHSQHEHQSLLSPETQAFLLDSYGGLQSGREEVGRLFRESGLIGSELQELREKVKERAHRLDLLKFQINEIDTAVLRTGEEEQLEEEKKILANLNRLRELAETAYSGLYASEGSCIELLSSVIMRMREMCAIDNSIEDALQLIESAKPLLDDAAFALRGHRERYGGEPQRLEMVEDRLELIGKLRKKYGDSVEEILRYRADAEEELKSLESTDERVDFLAGEFALKEEELFTAAAELSKKRKKTARELEALVSSTLEELAFGSAQFRIDIRQERGGDGREKVGPGGMDRIEFLFSANPGEPPKPLLKIISGGELSRVMLALKSILADADRVPVLIFDEVDAGIGGKTAESVGKKLDRISAAHQLLCITHLPQIASFGNHHLKIEKKEKEGRVYVEIRELDGKERREEIARMLSGKVTELSRRHAEELLEGMR
ncbi:MAG: DNA repair protein RecN [Candidatus Sulfobium sp.]|jgi:DNA repair protein RecN (Recombination protein N)